MAVCHPQAGVHMLAGECRQQLLIKPLQQVVCMIRGWISSLVQHAAAPQRDEHLSAHSHHAHDARPAAGWALRIHRILYRLQPEVS